MTPLRCAALIATKNRWGLLCNRSLPSIRRQLLAPEAVILINDGKPFAPEQIHMLSKLLAPRPLTLLSNNRPTGAAGAWNTGLHHLRQTGFDGYVAFLDDDDEWDEHHLSVNMAKAEETGADLIVSGLRRLVGGLMRPRALPEALSASDFLCGNPGLQGSNTFVAQTTLERVGDFTDGLPSLNDRDLAVRLLRCSTTRVAYTGVWTASWHHGSDAHALSTPRSAAKIQGLRQFWRIYGASMTATEEASYFHRALSCFEVTRDEIEAEGKP